MDIDKDIDWGILKKKPYKREDRLSEKDLIDLMRVAWDGYLWEIQEIQKHRRRKIEEAIKNS